jgi:DNA-binding FadR family transcriptional regulator
MQKPGDRPVLVSQKNKCIRALEEMILSGRFQIGEKLPAERKLAEMLNVSRPVLHEALVDLSTKGLVTIEARRGAFINDYRKFGSVALLSSLLAFHDGELDQPLVQSLISMRTLIEGETAKLAAVNRSKDQMDQIKRLFQKELKAIGQPDRMAQLNFEYHHLITVASGNIIYPLILNSFKSVYLHVARFFFSIQDSPSVVENVLDYHEQLIEAFEVQDPKKALLIMEELLQFAETILMRYGQDEE